MASSTEQVSAWTSDQSTPVDDRAELERRAQATAARFAEVAEIPRPPHWGGYRVVPSAIEFWLDGPNRLHDRRRFTRPDAAAPWESTRLYP